MRVLRWCGVLITRPAWTLPCVGRCGVTVVLTISSPGPFSITRADMQDGDSSDASAWTCSSGEACVITYDLEAAESLEQLRIGESVEIHVGRAWQEEDGYAYRTPSYPPEERHSVCLGMAYVHTPQCQDAPLCLGSDYFGRNIADRTRSSIRARRNIKL